MLRTFFEKTDEDTSVYFRNTLIEQCGKKYMEHQGKYPVVWLSFKDAKGLDWETCSGIVKRCLEREMMRHIEAMCAPSPTLQPQEVLGKLVDDQNDLGAWAESLKLLTELLQGETIEALVDTSIIYPLLHANPQNLYSLLLVSGYLKANPPTGNDAWADSYELSIPNREVTEAFKKRNHGAPVAVWPTPCQQFLHRGIHKRRRADAAGRALEVHLVNGQHV